MNILNDQVVPSVDFFSSLMARAYFKMTMPGFIRLRLWKSGSGSMRHHFSQMDWPPQSPDLNPTENLWDVAVCVPLYKGPKARLVILEVRLAAGCSHQRQYFVPQFPVFALAWAFQTASTVTLNHCACVSLHTASRFPSCFMCVGDRTLPYTQHRLPPRSLPWEIQY